MLLCFPLSLPYVAYLYLQLWPSPCMSSHTSSTLPHIHPGNLRPAPLTPHPIAPPTQFQTAIHSPWSLKPHSPPAPLPPSSVPCHSHSDSRFHFHSHSRSRSHSCFWCCSFPDSIFPFRFPTPSPTPFHPAVPLGTYARPASSPLRAAVLPHVLPSAAGVWATPRLSAAQPGSRWGLHRPRIHHSRGPFPAPFLPIPPLSLPIPPLGSSSRTFSHRFVCRYPFPFSSLCLCCVIAVLLYVNAGAAPAALPLSAAALGMLLMHACSCLRKMRSVIDCSYDASSSSCTFSCVSIVPSNAPLLRCSLSHSLGLLPFPPSPYLAVRFTSRSTPSLHASLHASLRASLPPRMPACPPTQVNVACFHPKVGGGLVYGTKEGKLRVLQHNRAVPLHLPLGIAEDTSFGEEQENPQQPLQPPTRRFPIF
ncbi:unnamed protein product [Closterium sp. NIES-54]